MVPVNGLIVSATAGRDAGKYFVIVDVIGDSAVLLADGKSRKLSHPKRKNRKHIRLTGETIALEQVTDKQLRRMLRAYAAKENTDGEVIKDV